MKRNAAGAIVAISFALATTASAVTIAVVNTNDNGAGSLRQAINDSNALGGNTIVFSNVTGTITLASGELLITNTVTILGPATSLALH